MKKDLTILIVLLCLAVAVIAGCSASPANNADVMQQITPTLGPTPEPTPEPTPSPTPVPTETPEPTPTPVLRDQQGYPLSPTLPPDMPYYIYIEKGSSTISIFEKGSDGQYSELVGRYITATGKTLGKTPTGFFQLGQRDRWHHFGADEAYTQYATSYYEGLYIHGPLYAKEQIDTMYHDQYYEIGEMVTSGCLRTLTECAYFIYEYCEPGTIVEIVNGSPRGTTADPVPRISQEYPHIDPTDPLHPANSVTQS